MLHNLYLNSHFYSCLSTAQKIYLWQGRWQAWATNHNDTHTCTGWANKKSAIILLLWC